MRITLHRAITPDDIQDQPCGICGNPFRMEAVQVSLGAEDPTHPRQAPSDAGYACETCIEYLHQRNPERFPSLDLYRKMLAHYPSPMFQTDGELAARDTSWEAGDQIYEDMVLWPAREDEELITPTVVRATDSDGVRLVETPVPGGDARALVVCRSEEDARAFMESAGYTEEGGYKPTSVGHEELRVLLNACGLDQVAMPEPWTGSGLVNFFDAEGFVKMLEDSLQEA